MCSFTCISHYLLLSCREVIKLQYFYKIIYHFELNQQQILFHHSFQPQLEYCSKCSTKLRHYTTDALLPLSSPTVMQHILGVWNEIRVPAAILTASPWDSTTTLYLFHFASEPLSVWQRNGSVIQCFTESRINQKTGGLFLLPRNNAVP